MESRDVSWSGSPLKIRAEFHNSCSPELMDFHCLFLPSCHRWLVGPWEGYLTQQGLGFGGLCDSQSCGPKPPLPPLPCLPTGLVPELVCLPKPSLGQIRPLPASCAVISGKMIRCGEIQPAHWKSAPSEYCPLVKESVFHFKRIWGWNFNWIKDRRCSGMVPIATAACVCVYVCVVCI